MGFLRAFESLLFSTDSSVENEEPAANGGAAPRHDYTVLAIDDDPSFLNSLRALLGSAGFNVLTSTSGPKGLDMLRYAASEVRVVLLDYNMPQFDGTQTLEYIRKLSPMAKVIGLTGADADLVAYRFSNNVDNLVQKPFRSNDLIGSIESLASNATPEIAPERN
jgi:CheY-like chemotaxis protein